MTSRPRRRLPSPRPRKAPRSRLLMMPETNAPAAPLVWRVLAGPDDAPPDAGRWTPGTPPPEDLRRAARAHGPVLLLPPAAATRFELPAPRGLKREEWPLLIARHRCDEDDGEPLTLARLDHAHGRLVLVGVSRALLDGWRATLAEAGLEMTAWAPAFLGQPDPPDGALGALPAGDDWMLRWRDAGGDAAPGPCHWLTWPRGEALPPALAEREWHPFLDDEDAAARLAFLGRHLPARLPSLEPAPGRAPARCRLSARLDAGAFRRIGDVLPWRRALLVVALGGLHLGLVAWQEHRLAAQDADRRLAARFVTPPGDAADARDRLARRTAALADLGQRDALIERRLSEIGSLPRDARLERLAVAGQTLTLSWDTRALTAADRDALRPRLAAVGRVEDTASALTLEVDLATPSDGATP